MKDYATSLVRIAPGPANSGDTLTVSLGHGDRFPAAPFYATVHPATSFPDIDNAEKVQVIAKDGDVFTIVRGITPTKAKSISKGWRISNALFADDLKGLNVDPLNGVKVITPATKGQLLVASSPTEAAWTNNLDTDIYFNLHPTFRYGIIIPDSSNALWILTIDTDGAVDTKPYGTSGGGGQDPEQPTSIIIDEAGTYYFVSEDGNSYISQES